MYDFGDVRTWQPDPLGTAGDALLDAVRTLEASKEEIESTAVPPGWLGIAGTTARIRQQALVADMEAKVERLDRMARGMLDAETSITELRVSIEATEGQASAQEFRIGDDGSVTSTAEPPTFSSGWEARAWSDHRRAQAAGIAHEIEQIMLRAVAIDSALLETIPFRDSTSDLRGLPDPEVAYQWSQLTDEERQRIIEQIVEEELADLDLDPPPTVTFVDPDDPSADPFYVRNGGANGWWSAQRNEIWLNPNLLDDPRRIHTAAHEARHTRQHAAVNDLDRSLWDRLTGNDPFSRHEDDGITREQAEAWRENSDNYIRQGDPRPGGGTYTFDDYAEQPVEEDAFETGRDYLNNMTAAELERLREESR